MTLGTQPAARRASVLALFLILAGGACGVAAAGLSHIDWIGMVEQRIQAASGESSEETRTWLQGLNLQRYLALTAIVLTTASVISFFRGAAIFAWATTSMEGIGAARSHGLRWRWGLPGFIGLAVFAHYPSTLLSGYFRYDDFDLISMAATRPLGELLFLPHGDHFLPLTRVLAHLLYHSAGVTAWPYNLLILLCMACVLYIGSRVLAELGTSRAGQLLFVVLVLFWSPWAELMTGYYILSTYLLIAVLSLTTFLCFLRWQKHRRPFNALGMVLSSLIAPLIDISGGYVLAAALMFLASDWITQRPRIDLTDWLAIQRLPLAGLGLAGVIVVGAMAYAYLVAHPGVFLGMAGDSERSWLRLAGDLLYVLTSGVLVSMVTPFVYARMPLPLLGTLATMVAVAWLWFNATAFRAADARRRYAILVMLGVILGTSLMVILGRPSGESFIIRWAAKHVCPIYIWVCLTLALGWDTLWAVTKSWRRLRLAEFTLIGLALFLGLQHAFGLIGMAVAFPPFGYPAEIRDAIRRRDAVTNLEASVVRHLATQGDRPVPVPILDGEFIKSVHPSLFSYNLANYAPFFHGWPSHVEFVRTASMQKHHAGLAKIVPRLREAVSPPVVAELVTHPELRSYYFGEAPLAYRVAAGLRPPAVPTDLTLHGGDILERKDSRLLVAVSDQAELLVKSNPWDPETQSTLRLAIESADASVPTPVPLRVIFKSDLLNADWSGTLDLPAGGELAEVDLRQAYAFSLSPAVGNLRIRFLTAGRYWLHHIEVAP